MPSFAHTGKWNPLRDRDQILRVCRYPGHNHVRNFWWWSVKGFGRGSGSNFPFSHWLASSPLQHFRTTVRVWSLHRHSGLSLWPHTATKSSRTWNATCTYWYNPCSKLQHRCNCHSLSFSRWLWWSLAFT